MLGGVLQVLHLLLALAAAPLLVGLIGLFAARLQGRRGPSPFQPYRTFRRLLGKETVLAHDASWIFRMSPYLIFAAMLAAAGMVPMFAADLPLMTVGDIVVVIALIATARFVKALAGLDVGTAFGGIGASRDALIAALAEPAILMVAFTLALVAGTTALPAIVQFVLSGRVGVEVSLALALMALLIVAIAESGRLPVGEPAARLELTMIRDAMALEYSGRHLALIEAAQMLKMLIFVSLITGLFAPWGLVFLEDGFDLGGLAIGLAVFALHLLIAAAVIAVLDVSIARMRIFRVIEFVGSALMLAVLAVIFRFVTGAS